MQSIADGRTDFLSPCCSLVSPISALTTLCTMPKPIVLQLGDDIRWNHDLYNKFQGQFEIKRSYSMQRPEFIRALKEKKFGDFFAIYRPFWNTGGEMGNWDEELISLLPASCKVYASAGAGFDWVDTATLAKKGENASPSVTWNRLADREPMTYRRCLLQCGCCVHRVRGRCRDLADHLHLPLVFLVSEGSARSRCRPVRGCKPQPGAGFSQPQGPHAGHHWLWSDRPSHGREGILGPEHEDPVPRHCPDATRAGAGVQRNIPQEHGHATGRVGLCAGCDSL